MVDTNVFIKIERSGKPAALSAFGQTERMFISAVSVSELLLGVYGADTEERRQRRAAFVEQVLADFEVLDFTTEVARVHAQIHYQLGKEGRVIGAHDLMIAATALQHVLPVLTANKREFSRVPNLHVIPYSAK